MGMLEPEKIPKAYYKDCDRCYNTFGSFGCCVTVNNEIFYDCVTGHKKELDQVIRRLSQEEEDARADWL